MDGLCHVQKKLPRQTFGCCLFWGRLSENYFISLGESYICKHAREGYEWEKLVWVFSDRLAGGRRKKIVLLQRELAKFYILPNLLEHRYYRCHSLLIFHRERVRRGNGLWIFRCEIHGPRADDGMAERRSDDGQVPINFAVFLLCLEPSEAG